MDAAPQPERYEIRSKIGQGGVGAVYRAYDRALKREVAIKRLLPQDDKPEAERNSTESLVHEAGLLSQLQHPNVVTVYDAGIDEDGGFVVMELIDGETIDKTVERGALTYDDFKIVVEQSLEGLIAAQDIGMLHRDLKPSNMMVRWLPSGRFEVKLLDFGLAKVTQKPVLQTIQHGDAILGSIYFMAPEQFDREPLDGRTDLYSMGCLYYFALAGDYPFDGETGAEVMVKKLEHQLVPIGEIRNDLPPAVCDWLMRLLARQREDRPESATAALDEFNDAVEHSGAAKPNPLIMPATAPPAPIPHAPMPAGHVTTQISTAPVGNITAPLVSGGPTPSTGAVPTSHQATAQLHTTSHFMTPPQGSNKKQTTVAALVTFGVLAAMAGGAFYLLSQKKDKPASAPIPEEDYDPYVPPKPDPPKQPKPPASPPVVLLPEASTWKYWDRGAPPEGWKAANFDDSSWDSGAAPLGYGEETGITTEISFGEDENKKRMSYYFRTEFDLQAANFKRLIFRFQVDDGCVFFLNGKPVARHSMPGGAEIAADQRATKVAGKATEANFITREIDANQLRKGRNVIAVQVHQDKPTSSDVRFELKLSATR